MKKNKIDHLKESEKIKDFYDAYLREQRNMLYLFGLNHILVKNNIPSNYFCIDGFSEEAICLELIDKKWTVYLGERGKKKNIEVYEDIVLACYDIINRLSDDENIKDKLIIDFESCQDEFNKVISTMLKRLSDESKAKSSKDNIG